jgi:Flp pilus assembly protein TadD
LDVAPTLLALAGLAPGEGMHGTVPQWLWSEGRGPGAADPVDYAALLPARDPQENPLPPEAREEELAKLRALGYIADSTGPTSDVDRRQSSYARPEVDRADARRLNNLGSSRYASGDLDGAEEIFRRAIAADPSYAAAHYNLSLLYRKQGQFDRADLEFWKAVEYGIADREMAVVRLALDYRQRGDTKHAHNVFLEGQRRFPNSGAIWLNSGVFFGEQGQYAEAIRSLTRAVELDPTNPRGHANLAVALLAAGRKDAARSALTEASRLDPSDEAIRRELDRLGGPVRE